MSLLATVICRSYYDRPRTVGLSRNILPSVPLNENPEHESIKFYRLKTLWDVLDIGRNTGFRPSGFVLRLLPLNRADEGGGSDDDDVYPRNVDVGMSKK